MLRLFPLRLLRLLLLRRTLARLLRLTRTAATATTPAPARRLLLAGRSLRLLRSLLLGLGLGLSLGTRTALLLLAALRFLLLALAIALPLVALPLRLLRPVLALHLLARALLEVAHLLVHVPRRLSLLFQAHLVVPAVRAPLPSLGIGFLAGGTKDAFRERHREIGAHCTLRAVDENRRRTLRTLIELAEENSPSACWDDRRATELLRKEATADELRELGMDEQMIAHVFAEDHGR